MSINNLLQPNHYTLYDKNSVIDTLTILGDDVNETITTTELYNAVAFSQQTGMENSLAGYDNTGVFTDVTVGSGLQLSGNVLQASGLGSGDVVGPNSSTVGLPCIFSGVTGKLIDQPEGVTFAINTLLGFGDTSLINVSAGANIQISAGVISSLGAGTGNVVGNASPSVAQTPAIYSDTTGLVIDQPAVTATADTILGYDDDGLMTNITAGANISIFGGVISASGGAGGGDVDGPTASNGNSLVIFSGTTGKIIQEHVSANNTLLGYQTTPTVSNITVGSGLSLSSGVLTATGSGSGDVSGPASSIAHTPAMYADTTGKVISQSNVAVSNNTLIGYNQAGQLTNIGAGTNIFIDNGLINANIVPDFAGLFSFGAGLFSSTFINVNLHLIKNGNLISMTFPPLISSMQAGGANLNIMQSNIGTPIIPVGYRPLSNVLLPVYLKTSSLSNGVVGVCLIDTSGNITIGQHVNSAGAITSTWNTSDGSLGSYSFNVTYTV